MPLNGEQFVITSNRDERIARPTLSPVTEVIGATKVIFPKDLEAGGTWIAAGDNGRICCLLNGAYVSHEKKSSYSKSRGKLVLAVFECEDIYDFFNHCNLEEVEPFTLIVIETEDEMKLIEFRWNSVCKQVRDLDVDRPYLWSSATLYNFRIREKREAWFKEWILTSKSIDREKILKFHSSSHGSDPENDLVMERANGLRTVSITQIELYRDSLNMHYHDLLKNQKTSLINGIKQNAYVLLE
jgi:uncharacterized protein with NRDE domain